jgi:hypothetical protein
VGLSSSSTNLPPPRHLGELQVPWPQFVGMDLSGSQGINGRDYSKRLCYPRKAMRAAIEDVHWGMTSQCASDKHGVPRRTVSYKLKHCKMGHPGPCPGAYLRHPEFRPLAHPDNVPQVEETGEQID